MLHRLVAAFNTASEVRRLVVTRPEGLALTVTSADRQRRLTMTAQSIPDLPMSLHRGDVARMVGTVELHIPNGALRPEEGEAFRGPAGMSGFNLVYRVPDAAAQFGRWTLLRFEDNPLVGRVRIPRWFALHGGELEQQLRLLQAMSPYQHQERGLDDHWFQLLLASLV
jgi:hypothetical protein